MNSLGDSVQRALVRIGDRENAPLEKYPLEKERKRTGRKIRFGNADDKQTQGIRADRIHKSGTTLSNGGAADAREDARIGAGDGGLRAAVLRTTAERPCLHLHEDEGDEEGENFFHGGESIGGAYCRQWFSPVF